MQCSTARSAWQRAFAGLLLITALHGSTPAGAQTALNRPLLLRQLQHQQPVEALAFAPDSATLATASRDKKVRLWDVETGRLLSDMAGHGNAVQALTFAPDGSTLISGGWDKIIRVWDVGTGKTRSTLSGHGDVVDAVSLSPDGKTLASGSWDFTVRLWDVESGNLLQTLQGHKNQVTSVAFSPDGRTLASGSWDNIIRLWDVETGKTRRTLSGHVDWVQSVRFSPDGKTLASASWDNTIRLWDVIGDNRPRILKGHQGRVSGIAFSPDGTMLASVGWDKTLRLWNVATGSVTQTLGEYGDWIQAVTFSPDGTLVATAGFDGIVKLWRVKAGGRPKLARTVTPFAPPLTPLLSPMSPAKLPVVVQPPAITRPRSEPLDLSSPEAAVRSFVAALNAVDLEQAVAVVAGVNPQPSFDKLEQDIKAGRGANALGHSLARISNVRVEVTGSLATVSFDIELAPSDGAAKITGTARLPLYLQGDKWKIMPRAPITLQTPLAHPEDFLLWAATALQRPHNLVTGGTAPRQPVMELPPAEQPATESPSTRQPAVKQPPVKPPAVKPRATPSVAPVAPAGSANVTVRVATWPQSEPTDLSSPEATVRSFVSAVNAVALHQAAACVLGVKPQLTFDQLEPEIKQGRGAHALGHSLTTLSNIRTETTGSLATVTFDIEIAPRGAEGANGTNRTTGTARLPLYLQEGNWKIMPRAPATLQTPLAHPEDFLLWVATALQRPQNLVKAAATPLTPY